MIRDAGGLEKRGGAANQYTQKSAQDRGVARPDRRRRSQLRPLGMLNLTYRRMMHRFRAFGLFFPVLMAPVFASAAEAPHAVNLEQRFEELRKNPSELYAFLLRMPKGGDLHYHLTGGAYAETYLRFAAEDGLCVDLKSMAIVAPPAVLAPGKSRCGDGVEASRAQSDNNLASALIDSLSMRNYVPNRESGHDHFFAAFTKFGPYKAEHRGELVAEAARRAADQNESYLELMAIGGAPVNPIGVRAGFDGNFEQTKDKLMAAGLPMAVDDLRARVDEFENGRVKALGCGAAPEPPPCRVVVRYIYQVTRESPKEQVFAQVIAGFMLAFQDPRVVAVNFVQPEDGANSMRDYHLQMQMVDYAKRLYPMVHITLHAGELASGLVPPEGLRFHIREAVELGHAERIGHGVSVMYEKDAAGLLEEMRARRVMVEINLTSNDLILGVRGKDHPLPVYLKHGVSVALSTDDEGVSRTHLTEEYQRAALDYHLSYAELKQTVRNSLEYAFLPGASYWRDASHGIPIAACGGGEHAKSCREFLEKSEKARLQVDLEHRFQKFEASIPPVK